jgi:hypothetical protein
LVFYETAHRIYLHKKLSVIISLAITPRNIFKIIGKKNLTLITMIAVIAVKILSQNSQNFEEKLRSFNENRFSR